VDESKCLGSKSCSTKRNREQKDPTNTLGMGMTSFTPAERSRFQETLSLAGLVDILRELHPTESRKVHVP